MLPRSVKIENEEIYRTRSRAQSVGGAGLSENVKCASIEREKLIPGVGSVCLAAHDRAMMPREGCLCQFISLLRQNQSPKLRDSFFFVSK